MVKKTYSQLKETIAALEREAERVRLSELADVVSKIKSAIAAYGITEKDLFGGMSPKPRQSAKPTKASKSKASSPVAKFADGKGGEWVGRGPRPIWLRDALAAGRSLNDFAVDGATGPVADDGPIQTPKKQNAAKKRRAVSVRTAKYKDGAGNEWSGRGRQPKWLGDALAGGKRLEDLRV